MQGKSVDGGQRGAAAVEYGVIVGLVSVVVMASVALLGGNLSGTFCSAAQSLGSDASCVQASSDPGDDSGAGSAAGSGSVAGGSGAGEQAGSGAVNNGGSSGSTDNSGSSGSPNNSGSSGSADAAATNSPGRITFYTAVVDQDQRKRDLSARFNLGWFPDSWSDVEYPESLTVDVTWSPALEVDQVITGSSGKWEYTLVEPGHMRLVRTGAVDAGGFNPEPEILLTKPERTQDVTVTFTAKAPNAPSVVATSTTTAVPYK